MEENAFSIARQMAQDLVRSKIEPAAAAELLDYLREHRQESSEAFFAHLGEMAQGALTGNAGNTALLYKTCEQYLGAFGGSVEDMIDVLGWNVEFMRYYRGEGNRPNPGRRPSQVRQGAPRPRKEARQVTIPLASLQVGQAVQGTIRRVVPYGIFVDIGAERDGLVHVSEMEYGFTEDPSEKVSAGEVVEVWVKSIDEEKKRISLTMKDPAKAPKPARSRRGPRREPAPEHAESAKKVFEDEVPKEMTALGEALRAALAAQEQKSESSDDESSRRKKRRSRPEELAELHRRTLQG